MQKFTMRLVAWLNVMVCLGLILGGCAAHVAAPVDQVPVRPPTSNKKSPSLPDKSNSRPKTHHVVRSGDTLYAIALRNGLDYRDVARWNEISPPYLIRVGEVIRLTPPTLVYRQRVTAHRPITNVVPPKKPSDLPTPPATATPAVAKPATPVKASSTPRAESAVSSSDLEPNRVAMTDGRIVGNIRWIWPVEGQVISKFSESQGSRRGLDILGTPGQPVRSTAAGKVVYSGSGLLGWGKLLIVKHDDTYLSAYGHNRTLLVNEGDRVRAGQPIAEMGEGQTDQAMLHFEIRKGGRPVDPLRYLPPR